MLPSWVSTCSAPLSDKGVNDEIPLLRRKRQGSYLHPDNLLTPWIPNSGCVCGGSREVVFPLWVFHTFGNFGTLERAGKRISE